MELTFEKRNSKSIVADPPYWFNIHAAINELKACVDSISIWQALAYAELNQT